MDRVLEEGNLDAALQGMVSFQCPEIAWESEVVPNLETGIHG